MCSTRALCAAFLLDHSPEYGFAAAASWVEFWLEQWLFPQWKSGWLTVLLGLALVVIGQSFRTAAMVTAKSNFTHQIASTKSSQHVLVAEGVYR